jgi:hypothetical protein
VFAPWLSIWINTRGYAWPECTKAKFMVFMVVIFVWMPALWFYNTSTFNVLAGQRLSSPVSVVQLTLLYTIFFRVLFMSVVQFPHVIILGFWPMFILVDWTVKNRTTSLVTFNQTLTSSVLELSVLEWNFFEETFCM